MIGWPWPPRRKSSRLPKPICTPPWAPRSTRLQNARRLEAETSLEEAQHSFELEQQTIEAQLEALSDEQIFALNRSLNNALSSGLNVDIDSEHLQDVIDGFQHNSSASP